MSSTQQDKGTLSVTRRLEWDAMHRIANHEGNCKAFHGHRYAAEITCEAPRLDALGRVVDFSLIKSRLGGWIEDHLDHTAILQENDTDPAVRQLIESNAALGKPVYLMPEPPTAENLATLLARQAQKLLADTGITVTEVRVWETPNCSATWRKNQS
ncbi:MAG: 6-pyruvoyl tetrahydropterin synthase family protein [Methyloligellaceae bacterium]